MVFKHSIMSPANIFSVSLLFATLLETYGQYVCTPSRVLQLSLSATGNLTWYRPFDVCEVGSYLVTIRKEGRPTYVFNVQPTSSSGLFNPSLDVSFLPICESFDFSVIAISTQHAQGLEEVLSTKTPPIGLDLTVDHLNATQTGQTINLSWRMKIGVEECVDSFRLVVWDENTVDPNDIYVRGYTFSIENVVPCMRYKFEIRAIVGAEEEGNSLYRNYTTVTAPPGPPTLAGINQSDTTVNITWNLPSFESTRCPILEVIADASPNFNTSFGLFDSPQRPPFIMRLRNLQPNTIYLLRILVVNRAGASPPLAIAVQTQPGNGINEISSPTQDQQQLQQQLPSFTYNKHSDKLKTSHKVVQNESFKS